MPVGQQGLLVFLQTNHFDRFLACACRLLTMVDITFLLRAILQKEEDALARTTIRMPGYQFTTLLVGQALLYRL